MSISESGPIVAETAPADATMSTSGNKAEFLTLEAILAKPNSESANRTQVVHFNGGSDTFAVRHPRPYLIPLPRRLVREYFIALQKWEGYVTEVGQDTFHARLIPLLGEGSDLEAEIWIEEIDGEDRTLLQPGAIFYWSIGYLDRPSGRQRTSIIRFQRLPVWTKRELEAARAEAAKLKELLDVN